MFYMALKTVYKILGVTVIGELKNVIHIVWCRLTEKLETLGELFDFGVRKRHWVGPWKHRP